jgi:hypothetical protein
MFGKETGTHTTDAKITPAGSIPVAGEQMSNGSMDYKEKNMAKATSDVSKIKRTKVK